MELDTQSGLKDLEYQFIVYRSDFSFFDAVVEIFCSWCDGGIPINANEHLVNNSTVHEAIQNMFDDVGKNEDRRRDENICGTELVPCISTSMESVMVGPVVPLIQETVRKQIVSVVEEYESNYRRVKDPRTHDIAPRAITTLNLGLEDYHVSQLRIEASGDDASDEVLYPKWT